MSKCFLSLILCTFGRKVEVKRFLDSLKSQHQESLELIVVDQNDDFEIESYLREVGLMCPVKYLRHRPGLSISRNYGLKAADGEFVGFPDDDCIYPQGLLDNLVRTLKSNPSLDGIAYSAKGLDGGSAGPSWDVDAGLISRKNVWRRAISYTLFLRKTKDGSHIHFLENLGVGSGSDYTSGEETEMLIRSIDKGWLVQYEPSLAVFHPDNVFTPIEKAQGYARGAGYVLGKRKYGLISVFNACVRALASSIIKKGYCSEYGILGGVKIAWSLIMGYRGGRMDCVGGMECVDE